MTKRISTLALMTCLAGSLAFAQDMAKAAPSAEDAGAATAKQSAQNSTSPDSNDNCPPEKANKKAKRDAKPASQKRTKEDEEFDRVLQGTYGG